MDTKLKRKKTINMRILISFLLVLVMTFIITIVIHSALSQQFLIREAKLELKSAAVTAEVRFIEYLSRQADSIQRTRGGRMISELELFNDVLSSNTIVIGNENNIIYPRKEYDFNMLQTLKETSMIKGTRYVFYHHVFTEDKIPFKSIYMLREFDDVQRYRKIGVISFVISFGIGLLAAILMSFVISQRIYKPIKLLKNSMSDYMSDKSEVIVFNSNDEIEELAHMFKSLTDQANKLNSRQKEFFENSSHELKTPLMSIQGYAEGIKDGVIKEEDIESSLDIIISETQRLKHIVDDVIYLSKIDSLEDEFVLKIQSVHTIIEDAISVTSPLIQENHLQVLLTCEEEIEMFCDYDKMKRVFINLIGNASRYAKSKILINVNSHDELLIIEVIDDGKGLEYGQEEAVFDRFHKGKNGGSGIGLSLTKELVEKHGGTIKAISHMNYGAIFKMEFKIKDVT